MQVRYFVFGLMLSSIANVRAEQDKLTISNVLERSERSVDVRMADYGADAVRAQARQAARWENPVLEMESENVGGTAASGTDAMETSVLIKQAVDLTGRRAAERRSARKQVAAAEAECALARREASREARRLFYSTLATEQRQALADEQWRRAQKLAEIARARVDAGAASPLEVERAKVDLVAAKSTVSEVAHAAREARRKLSLHLNETVLPALEGDLFAPASFPGMDSLDARKHPQTLMAESLRAARAEQMTAARRSAWGDVELAAGWKQAEESDTGSWILGLGVALPLWHRNPGVGGEAMAGLKQAEAQSERTLLSATLEMADARKAAESAAEQADYLGREALPSAMLLYEGMQEAYRAGKSSQIDALMAHEAWAATANRRIDAFEQLRLAEADVFFWIINP